MTRFILCFFLISFTQTHSRRVLSLYTTNAQNTAYLSQLQILEKDPSGLNERDLIIKKYVYSKDNAHLFEEHKIKDNFMIVLTGKDGGEKFRSEKPVNLKRLYGLIDAMPMRKAEIKEKHNQ